MSYSTSACSVLLLHPLGDETLVPSDKKLLGVKVKTLNGQATMQLILIVAQAPSTYMLK